MSPRFKKLISYYKPYKKELILDLFFSSLSALIAIAIPLIIRYITNDVFKFERQKAVKVTLWLTIEIFLLFILLYLCNRHMKIQGKTIGLKIEEDMCTELFNHYQKLSFSFYDDQSTGKLMSRMTIDIRNMSKFLHTVLEESLSFLIKFIAVFTAFFMIDTVFGFVAIGIFGLIFLLFLYIGPKVDIAYNKSHESISSFNGIVEESLAGMRTIQSFGAEKAENIKFQKLIKNYFKDVKAVVRITSFIYAVFISFINGLIPIIAIIAILFGINGNLNIGELITLMLFTDIIIAPVWSILELWETAQESWVGYKRFLEILAIKPEIVDSPTALSLDNIGGSIEFKNVSFKYARSETKIFKNLNLKINAGEYIALVGSSGTGKSTLCNLISRFYDISSGEILVDNINVKNIKIENLRQNIGFVHQDTFLFSGTIIENIRYGNPNATDEEIFEAAKNAYAHDFIMKFPDRYNTQIGQRGIKLSGGQKQRLAISRAFLKNPPILILDEATSSLDNESERYIQKSMERLAKNRTNIVIAHRLSTIKNAKRILVIADGKISEEGTHEQLLNKNGAYAEFYNLL